MGGGDSGDGGHGEDGHRIGERGFGGHGIGGHGLGLDAAAVLRGAGVIGLWDYRLDEGLVYGDHAMARSYSVDPILASTGLPPEAYCQAIHPDDKPRSVALLNNAIETGADYIVRYRLKGGARDWQGVEVRGRAHRCHGKTTRITGVSLLAGHNRRDEDRLNRIAELAIEIEALAKQLADRDMTYFAELLLFQVGSRLATRLKQAPPEGQG